MTNRVGSAVWHGTLKEGRGTLNVERAGFEAPYTFGSRFEDQKGMSPEDLITTALAACFAMALSANLEKAGNKADRVDAKAQLTLEPVDGAPTITKIHLDVNARVPNIDQAKLAQTAQETSKTCPVARLYKADITVDAKLV